MPQRLSFPASNRRLTGDPQGFTVWKAADLKARGEQLAANMGATKTASEILADYGHYNTMMSHRETSGGGELHEKMADLFVIQSGDATVVVGGSLTDSRHRPRRSTRRRRGWRRQPSCAGR